MRFAALGSGSRGNGVLVEGRDTCLLIDCGFSVRETERRLARLGRCASDLSAVLVTHEHSDHVAGVAALARKYQLPIYATAGTGLGGVRNGRCLGEAPTFHVINPREHFTIGGLTIRPVLVPHDAREPSQYVVSDGLRKFGLLTDLGSITPTVLEAYSDCDGLMLECNHDSELLAAGPYHPALKRRVGGPWGHLSNAQAAHFITRVERRRLQCVVMSHLSEQNNTVELATAAMGPALLGSDVLIAADQTEGVSWQELI
ncbi:MAG: MBL fold metallo-hydrolase [Spongiibacteraceae bacterium]|jgi:phosphoribosyl 1,2-cyclic phosphodiesterase|nr:MBL fold metallo-hydrolase [Spongiibacteraceae bacterium]